jgi:predicted transport protein
LEKSLQTLIEQHLETFLGVRFLATEYYTGRVHKGFIDTLGIDENHCPVIIEYKRSTNENVINQGLFYLDWLMDHKAEFKLLVMERLGREEAEAIEWNGPRLLCIAGDFNRYDEHAVQQINRNIELVRYRKYGQELILFELVNAVSALSTSEEKPNSLASKEKGEKKGNGRSSNKTKTVSDYYDQAGPELRDLFESLRSDLMAMGDDVQMKTLKHYFAFKLIKNFACVEIHPWYERLALFVKVDPDSIQLEEGFTADVRNTGHFGTGDLRIDLKSMDDLEKAKPLLLRSYESS